MRDGAAPGSDEFETYLYHITHDLKAATRAISVLPDWVRSDLAASRIALPGAVEGHLDMLQVSARRLDRMLDGLTELSRVGRLASEPGDHRIADLAGTAWSAVAGGAGFALDLAAGDARVRGPANDLLRLFAALLSNAVMHHAANAGAIRVSAEIRGPRVHVTVADDGPGIPAALRGKAFEPLQTLQSRDERDTAGMGLAIARKVVRSLGGDIAIRGEDDVPGCRVEFDLPAGDPPRGGAPARPGR